jgi:hypothetical protein
MRDDSHSTGVHIMPAWAGGWDNVVPYGSVGGTPHTLMQQSTSTMRGTARLTHSVGGQYFGELGRALAAGAIGVSQVDLKIKQVAAIQADGMNQGGQRPIADFVIWPQRVTTIQDREVFQAQMTPTWAPVVYPVEKSGNSGGGFIGTVNK